MVNSEGNILLHKTDHDRGRIHDYEIFKNRQPTTPLQVKSVLDLGYVGVQNDFPTTKLTSLLSTNDKDPNRSEL